MAQNSVFHNLNQAVYSELTRGRPYRRDSLMKPARCFSSSVVSVLFGFVWKISLEPPCADRESKIDA